MCHKFVPDTEYELKSTFGAVEGPSKSRRNSTYVKLLHSSQLELVDDKAI